MGLLLSGGKLLLSGGGIVRMAGQAEPPADVAPTDIVFSANSVPYDAAEDDVLCTLSAPGATEPVTYTIVGGDDAALVYVDGAQIKRSGSGSMTADDVLDIDVQADNGVGSPYVETWAPAVTDPEAAVEVWQVGIRDDSGFARTDVPVMFRLPLPTGSSGVAAAPFPAAGNTVTLSVGGTPLPAQISARTVADDGTLTGVTVATVVPSLAANATVTLVCSVAPGSDPAGTSITWDDVKASGWNARMQAVLGGVTYTSDPTTVSAADTTFTADGPHYRGKFIDGPYCACFVVSAPFMSGASTLDPHTRVHYHVYAYKAGAAAVSGENPIIAVRVDRLVERSAFNPASWSGDVTVDTLRTLDAAGATISEWSAVAIYSLAASDLEEDYWWAPGGANKGGWTALHETSAGGIRKLIDYGWVLPTPVNASLVAPSISSWDSTINASSSKPFVRQFGYVNAQGDTGSRAEICYIHRVEYYSALNASDASRRNARVTFTSALKQPLRRRRQTTGRMVDWMAADAAILRDHAVNPSPKTNPITIDLAHQPLSGHVLYMLEGKYKYLEHMQFVNQDSWLSGYNGNGPNRRLTMSSQARAAAWAIRTAACCAALTPNDMSTALGQTKSEIQSWINASMGDAGNVQDSPAYPNGAKRMYWGPGVTASGRFNNSDPLNHRYIISGQLIAVFMEYYYATSMTHAWRLNVLNADGLAFLDWVLEILPRRLDAGTPGFSDQFIDNYSGPIANTNGVSPKTVALFWRDALSATESEAGWTGRPNLNPSNSAPSSVNFGITSYDVDATDPAAVTVRFNGASAIQLFDDGEDGAWFLGTGAYVGRGGALYCAATGPDMNGRIIAVDLDGRGCTINTTVAGGVTPTSGTGRAPGGLRLPFAGPNSPWFTPQWWVNNGTNDYTTAGLSALNFLKMRSPSRPGLDAYRAYVHDRAANYRSNAINDPLTSSDADLWELYGDISDLVGV